jgi:hypothetical protein
MVRVGMGTADIRYRGEFYPWFVRLNVRYNTNALSEAQILNLFNTAGFGVGIGEWRTERDGNFGSFRCADQSDMKWLAELESESPKPRKARNLKRAV